MLLRKLLVTLGSVAVLLLAVGITTIGLLHAALKDLDTSTDEAFRRSAAVNNIARTLTAVEADLGLQAAGTAVPLGALLRDVSNLERMAAELEGIDGGTAVDVEERCRASVARLRRRISGLMGSSSGAETAAAIAACAELRVSVDALGAVALEDAHRVQARLARRLRWTIIGLGLAFVVLLNASIVLLMRAGIMVVRPVGRLVDASRRLAREEFDHRVHLDQRDEFGELARATNALAEQLQHNEERKLETLRQVARTLNHELNNALAIIQLQLDLVARQAAGGDHLPDRMRQIHDALARMRGTVAALTRIRRIVITEYTEGVEMLDLDRSLAASGEPAGAAPTPAPDDAGPGRDATLVRHEKLSALGRLAAGVAHEIANPLANLDSVIQLGQARGGAFDAKQIEAMRSQVARIDRLVRQLGDFSHPGDASLEATRLDAIVDDALAMVRLDHRMRSIDVRRDVAPDPAVVSVSRAAVQQVMVNLLLNAADALDGAPAPQIEIRVRTDGPWAVIEVGDNGEGVPAELRGRIFEPFFTTKPVGRGTGLGLSISRDLVERHGGRIDVTDGAAGGATFLVRLPISRSRENGDRSILESGNARH